jgi:hypothetical protein
MNTPIHALLPAQAHGVMQAHIHSCQYAETGLTAPASVVKSDRATFSHCHIQ